MSAYMFHISLVFENMFLKSFFRIDSKNGVYLRIPVLPHCQIIHSTQPILPYLPYIAINMIDFRIPEGNPDLFPNSLSVAIIFNIVPLRTETSLQINIDN